MVSHSDEGNRFAYVPKDWMDELSSQHRPNKRMNPTPLSRRIASGGLGKLLGALPGVRGQVAARVMRDRLGIAIRFHH